MLKRRLNALGHGIFYMTMRVAGYRGAICLLWLVVSVYVICSRTIHCNTRPYLRRRFPEHGPVALWLDTFRNIISFGRVLVDKGWLGVNRNASLSGTFKGLDRFMNVLSQGNGAVLLLAHTGNWQTAFADLHKLPVRVNALMQYSLMDISKHYFDLRGEDLPFNIIDADGKFEGAIEAVAALERGEIVTIMGDRHAGGVSVEINFLGSPARFPALSYLMAACAKAPVVILFAAMTGNREYQLEIMDIFWPEYVERGQRQTMLEKSAERFARSLEKYLNTFPYQWYNFYDFWAKE